MGGYAFYVWTSFGLTALVMLATLWSAHQRKRTALTRARRRAMDAGT